MYNANGKVLKEFPRVITLSVTLHPFLPELLNKCLLFFHKNAPELRVNLEFDLHSTLNFFSAFPKNGIFLFVKYFKNHAKILKSLKKP